MHQNRDQKVAVMLMIIDVIITCLMLGSGLLGFIVSNNKKSFGCLPSYKQNPH